MNTYGIWEPVWKLAPQIPLPKRTFGNPLLIEDVLHKRLFFYDLVRTVTTKELTESLRVHLNVQVKRSSYSTPECTALLKMAGIYV